METSETPFENKGRAICIAFSHVRKGDYGSIASAPASRMLCHFLDSSHSGLGFPCESLHRFRIMGYSAPSESPMNLATK